MLNDGASDAVPNGRRRVQSVGSHIKHEKTDMKSSGDNGRSPGYVRPTSHAELSTNVSSSVMSYDVIPQQQFSGPTTLSMKSFKTDQSSSILVTSDLAGEPGNGHVSQITPLAWIPFGSEQLSSVGSTVDSDVGPSTYPLPLLPISEIFDPVEPSASCEVQLVELQSPPVYSDYQFQTSSAPDSVAASQASLAATVASDWGTSICSTVQSLGSKTLVNGEGNRQDIQILSPQQPGWSLLRQMLVQTHQENALMHGITDVSRIPDSWNWMQSDSELTQAIVSRHDLVDVAMLRSSLSSVDAGATGGGAEEQVDLLSGITVVVEPLDQSPASNDPSFTCKPEDFKYGDAWNVNLNMILASQDETVNNNNNLKLCEVNFTGES
jgi:hypothetical protein